MYVNCPSCLGSSIKYVRSEGVFAKANTYCLNHAILLLKSEQGRGEGGPKITIFERTYFMDVPFGEHFEIYCSQMTKNAFKLSNIVGEKFEIYRSQMAKKAFKLSTMVGANF